MLTAVIHLVYELYGPEGPVLSAFAKIRGLVITLS